MGLSPRHGAALALLTLAWGLNWPVMKLGVSGFPPLTFRAVSMALGLPVLGAALALLQVRWRLPRAQWPELLRLTLTNVLVWNVLVILALPMLSSGRAAILGYTMPVFSALWGAALFGQRLTRRQAAGVAAAVLGIVLLLWHELGRLAGAPAGVAMMLVAAAVWAFGTQRLRATTLALPTLALVFWMTALATAAMALAALAFESHLWRRPDTAVAWAIAYNAVAIFGFAQTAWCFLARTLPPAASTLSVMAIPVLGTVSGALWLGETQHWQDGAALVLMALAIVSVLWPQRRVA